MRLKFIPQQLLMIHKTKQIKTKKRYLLAHKYKDLIKIGVYLAG